jgi:hypothetical protein
MRNKKKEQGMNGHVEFTSSIEESEGRTAVPLCPSVPMLICGFMTLDACVDANVNSQSRTNNSR